MPDDHKTDVMMRFTMLDGNDVDAECALDKNAADPFMKDFVPQTYDSYSNFFEVSKFSFGFDVKDEDKTKSSVSDKASSSRQGTKALSGRVQGEFASWRSASETQAPEVIFPVSFQPFRFERLIDSASPVFFHHCCYSLSFKSAALVKRVARDGENAAESFLRIDFLRPMITSLSWDDGDMTTEKAEFVCRDFKIQYRQQKADGSFKATVPAKWNSIKDALPQRNGQSR